MFQATLVGRMERLVSMKETSVILLGYGSRRQFSLVKDRVAEVDSVNSHVIKSMYFTSLPCYFSNSDKTEN